jgi:hypothetical protein
MRYSNGAGAGSGFPERGLAFTPAWQARMAIKGNGEESKELDRLCLTAHVTRCLGGAVCSSFSAHIFFYQTRGISMVDFCFFVLHRSEGWFRGGLASASACAGVAGRLQSDLLEPASQSVNGVVKIASFSCESAQSTSYSYWSIHCTV